MAATEPTPPEPAPPASEADEVPVALEPSTAAATAWERGWDWARGPKAVLVLLVFGLVGALCGTAAAMLTTVIAPAQYTASADTRLVVEGEPGHPDAGIQSAFRQAEVLANLALGPGQLDAIGRTLDPPATGTELAEAVTARRQPEQLIITFSARDEDPDRAAAIANATADGLVEAMSRNTESRIRMEHIGSAAAPEHPSHRWLVRNVALGAIGGAALALVAALVVRRRQRPIPLDRERRSADRRAITLGAALGLVLIGGIALQLPDGLLRAIAAAGLGLAALAPGAGLAILALTLPLREPPGFTPIGYPALLIAATAYGLLLTRVASRSWPKVSMLGLLALGYLAFSAASIIPAISGLGGSRLVEGIVRLAQIGMGLMLVAVAWSYFSRRDASPHLALAVAGAALAGLAGILQYMAGGSDGVLIGGLIFDPPGATEIARANGPFFNTNYFGFFLGVALVAALSLALTGGRMMLVGLAAIPIGVALALTFSRGAFLATGVGLVVLVWSRSRLAGLALAGIAVAAIAVSIPSILALREGLSFIPPPTDLRNDISDSGRLEAMLSAFPIWRLDPIFGVGLGQYGAESAWFVRSSPATSSHNEYLSILAEQGLLGVALFGAMALLYTLRIARGGSWSRSVALAPLAAFAAGWMIIEPLASLQTSGLIWLLMGAAGGAATLAADAADTVALRGDQEVTRPRPAIAAGALAR